MPVFVIAHDNNIVHDLSLGIQPVMIVELEGYIVVSGQYKLFLPAQHGQLPQKLYIMLSAFYRYSLKVNIDTVQPQACGSFHNILCQTLPFRRRGENLIAADRSGRLQLIIKIVPYPPYLNPGSVRLIHILPRRIGAEGALVVREAEPCGRDNIDASALLKHCVQRSVAAHSADRVPAKADPAIHGNTGIFLHIIRHRRLLLRAVITQALVLHIADHGIGGLHPAPGLHLLENFHRFAPLKLLQNGAFNPSLDAQLRVLCYLRRGFFSPFRVDLHMPVKHLI